MNINIQDINCKNQKALGKKYTIFSILLLLSTFIFQLSTFSQTAQPFPTDHLQLWLRADSVQLTNGKVSRWYDISPNDFMIYAPTADRYPTLKENAVN
ncbi:MAG: hypothetical protein J6T48_08000, partial [Bacteroidales bacterium]|nr:hypothetical protein [Bacteroidales bacterium]